MNKKGAKVAHQPTNIIHSVRLIRPRSYRAAGGQGARNSPGCRAAASAYIVTGLVPARYDPPMRRQLFTVAAGVSACVLAWLTVRGHLTIGTSLGLLFLAAIGVWVVIGAQRRSA